MLIVADRNIPQVQEAFAGIGEVRLHEGRSLKAADVRDAGILLVRSVTPVTADLLKGSQVRFVGAATIGTDHVDLDYLQRSGIEFAYAPGSNARAVAEYVVAVLLALHAEKPQGPVGIVGYGNIGRALAGLLDVLGIEYLINDPPLQQSGTAQDVEFVSLAEIQRAPIISLHVPLVKTGPHPTHHLVDAAFLQQLSPRCLLLNTARGAVVDNRALAAHTQRIRAVLDVWEGEPAIDPALLEHVLLGTPHIAGYSAEGRLNGTQRMYEAVCEFLRLEPVWRYARPAPRQPVLSTQLQGYAALRDLVLQAYDVRQDAAQLRVLLPQPAAERAAGFDRLRRDYPARPEFAAYRCRLEAGADAIARRQVIDLGFTLV
jgi:erythronate-4-phosphate dehydrogenase